MCTASTRFVGVLAGNRDESWHNCSVVSASSVHIFDYLDYRAYLRDYYRDQKDNGRSFSFRAFAQRAGIRSFNFLQLVMKGQRDLSAQMALHFAKGCGLGGHQADYFCEMVTFCQAKTSEERNRAYERLGRFRQFRLAHRLEPAQAAYHSSWYIPAIRELVALPDFVEDPKWIGNALRPAISPTQAREALSVLQELGLLVRDASGTLRQSTPLLTTGPGPLGHHVVNYHRSMLEQAARALDEVSREERDISALTLCVSQRSFQRLRERIDSFRQELLQLAELDGPADRVVQVGLQLFPLSNIKKGAQ
jgi:uncharacterized protein (TIGR02147 family)